ncbi:MAG TPA: hypothetical protein VJI15_02395, partial [Candidatus Nanoarchaeia archaeon]|nr:hypothetical protein [Candidatus Nanoarchaeia archaeon]
VRFRQRQHNELDELISERRSYRERYQEFLSRGLELTEYLPLLQRRIIPMDRPFFKPNPYR